MGRAHPEVGFDPVSPKPALGPSARAFDPARLGGSAAAMYQLLSAENVPATEAAAFVDARDLAAAQMWRRCGGRRAEGGGMRWVLGSHFDCQSAVDAIRG